MKYVPCDVATLCIGQAYSMSAILLAGGYQGQSATPLLILGSCCTSPGEASAAKQADIEIHAREIVEWRDRLNQILVQDTSQPLERIELVTERDYFLSPAEAIDFGLIDGLLASEKELATLVD